MRRSRRRRERELDEEIRTHFRMAVEERVARGEPREEAERAVRREFGNEARVREVTRTMWGGVWMDRLAQDVRYGVRVLRRTPGFTMAATMTLGLGIGATTAMFTVVDGVLLRPLPFEEPERLVSVSVGETKGWNANSSSSGLVSNQDVPSIRASDVFSVVGTHLNYPPVTLTGAGDAARLNAAFVSAEFHRMLGISPVVGTGLAPGDDVEGAAPVVVLGNALWQDRFGADPGVVGRFVTLDGSLYAVVGVMPPGFDFPGGSDLWLPSSTLPFTIDSYSLGTIARLAEGVSLERARAELSAVAARLHGPDTPSGVQPLQEVLVGEARASLLLFLGAVGLVLLIACTNVGNLQLMRATTRAREIGLRKALGAAHSRIVRQLLTESAILSLAGGGAGFLLAWLAVPVLLSMAPPGTLPRVGEIGVDGRALLFTGVVSAASGILFGFAPAFRSAKREAAGLLTEGSRTYTPGRGIARRVLVTVEISLAVTLLVCAGLLIRSFTELRSVKLGFQPERSLTLQVDLPERVYDDAGALADMHHRIVDQLRDVPGVVAAGASNMEPFGPFTRVQAILIEDVPPGERGYNARPLFSTATPDYLASMGMSLLEGRDFTAADESDGPGVALINRTMAERYWPAGSPIGRRLALTAGPAPNDWRTIVGVVEDVVLREVATAEPEPMFWIPMAQTGEVYILAHVEFVVRALGPSDQVAAAMRDVVRIVDPNVPSGSIVSMEDAVLETMGGRRFEARILATFALIALLLAGVGIFGVTAHAVTERFPEIGIRMALGAGVERVASRTLWDAAALVAPGLALGGVLGVVGSRLLSSSLYQVRSLDPPTLVGVTLVLGAVAMLSSAIPAWRASRVDPVLLLRME